MDSTTKQVDQIGIFRHFMRSHVIMIAHLLPLSVQYKDYMTGSVYRLPLGYKSMSVSKTINSISRIFG